MKTDLSVQNNVAFTSSFYNGFFKKLPNTDVKNSVNYNKLGHALASPHWNRLVLGAAAITTQPAIDYFNPRVDKDTASTSALRTLAKIIVCTSVGFAVRGGCSYLVNKYITADAKGKMKSLIPAEILKETNSIKKENMLKLHKNTMSTLSALSVMVFTNFLLDAPGATWLANKFIGTYKSSQNKKEVKYA